MKSYLVKSIFFSFFFIPFLSPILPKVEEVPFLGPHKPKILIVPGHDNEVWGAKYKTLKEAELNLIVGQELYNILSKDKRFEVYTTRDAAGYTQEFADYFVNNQKEITFFRNEAKIRREEEIKKGEFTPKDSVPHNVALEEVSIRLYGINKWANENGIDAVIHIHFNDYPRSNMSRPGKYKGFAIYLPESEMSNSVESFRLAKSVWTELKKHYTTSTYEQIEKGGLVPDQELIALGKNGTLDHSVRSMLVEYGYIYRFAYPEQREQTLPKMAELTATGVKNYFFGN